MQVCFIGHREIEKTEELVSSLKNIVEMLINKGATTFLFGSKSNFDDLAWEIVTELKEQFPEIKRIYVRSSFQYIDQFYEEYLRRFYEETYFPKRLEKAGKASYVERNYEMIDNATHCIFYYNENYNPSARKKGKEGMILRPSGNSGTKIAYAYALRKKKEIINLYK